MGSKFIPPPDQINSISAKKSKKSFSDQSNQSIFHELKKSVKESYKTDAFEQVGQLNAIVLEVIDTDPTKMLWKSPLMSYAYYEKNTMPDYIEIRYRVPEIHAHLPEPESPEDFKAINRHPKAIMKKDKGVPEVGDIVTLDFRDKNNFSGAMVVESLNSEAGPNPGGNCSPAETFESATPSLNVSPATGDSQDSLPQEYSAKNDPPEDAFSEGIDYSKDKEELSLDDINKTKRAIYLITIDNLNTMIEFQNLDKMIDILYSKNVFNVCFTVAENERIFYDFTRLKKMIETLNKNNFSVGLSAKFSLSSSDEDKEKFINAYSVLTDLVHESKVDYIVYHSYGENIDLLEDRDMVFGSFCRSLDIDYYLFVSENSYNDVNLGKTRGLPNPKKTFYLNNHYNFEDRLNAEKTDFIHTQTPKMRPAYYLHGENFLKTPINPCLYGERTVSLLNSEWYTTTAQWYTNDTNITNYSNNFIFMNYEYLDSDKIEWIQTKLQIGKANKQNLLSSSQDIVKAYKANVEHVEGTPSTPTIESPVFNETGGSQDASEAPVPPESPSSPGAQCTPIDGGATSVGETNAGPSAPVTPPSYRFDSIENYESLGWAASAHHIINDVIFEYMQRFSAAVYRRLPRNSPSFTGSVPKKIKLTSTARTAQKQVELMWDKIRQGGDNAVWNLYGRSSWVTTVVNQYHAGQMQPAINVIQDRIDSGVVTGHLSGKGVDVHTWSHLDAEGINSDGASVDTMNSSKFVQAIVAAARECNSRPVVESYQQHVHITIL